MSTTGVTLSLKATATINLHLGGANEHAISGPIIVSTTKSPVLDHKISNAGAVSSDGVVTACTNATLS